MPSWDAFRWELTGPPHKNEDGAKERNGRYVQRRTGIEMGAPHAVFFCMGHDGFDDADNAALSVDPAGATCALPRAATPLSFFGPSTGNKVRQCRSASITTSTIEKGLQQKL